MSKKIVMDVSFFLSNRIRNPVCPFLRIANPNELQFQCVRSSGFAIPKFCARGFLIRHNRFTFTNKI